MKIVRRILLVVIGLAVVAGLALALRPRPIPVETARAAVGPMRCAVDEEGRTRIRERYVVSSPLRGRLRRIDLDPGDPVRADDTLLAVIEPTAPELLDARALAEAEARVRAAEAAVRRAGAIFERARIAYDFAENELTRIAGAAERGAASPRELDEAQTAERDASADFDAARFAREIATFELEVSRSALLYARGDDGGADDLQMLLRSPIDGAVLRVFQESVAVVTPGTPLLEIGDPRDLEIVIDVLSTDAVRIRPGARVIVGHWGGETDLAAEVRLVEPSGFTKVSALGIEEQRVNVIADFITPRAERATLGDAFRVEASIVVWEAPEVLQVPAGAVFRHGEGWAVFVVDEDRAARRAVTIGRENGRTVQILDGLVAGDRVVAHPGDRLTDGARVAERAAGSVP